MRTIIAGVLTAAALIALLVGWFGSGWAAVHAEQRRLREAPRVEAEAQARALAAELAGRLEELRRAESARPYYHYGNLFHDPRGASEGVFVAPSPLEAGPSDPLVRGHFQIALDGTVAVPTVNDAAPELTNAARADEDRALRGQLALVAPALVVLPDRRGGDGGGGGVLVAQAEPPKVNAPADYEWIDVPDKKSAATSKTKKPSKVDDDAFDKAQIVELPVSAYMQNAAPQQVYQQVKGSKSVGKPQPQPVPQPVQPMQGPAQAQQVDQQLDQGNAAAPPPQAANPPPQAANPPPQAARPAQAAQTAQMAQSSAAPPRHTHRVRVRRRAPAPPPAPPPAPSMVQVTVNPMEWRPVVVGGEPALVAVRRIDTPDGSMTQGLVVLASAAGDWMAERAPAGVHVTASRPAGGLAAAAVPIGAPGWFVTVDDGDAVRAADLAAAPLEAAFLGRFVPVAVLAALCGLLVVMVVARAEKLARERARFAAAAAHELRTPLAGLQLYGDMLADGLGDPGKSRDYARRMAEEASRLGRVVSNVLGFSQLERGNLSVHPAPGDVAAAVRGACERARPTLERAGVALAVDADGELRARFDGDALARVVGNLLDNAEKYGREAADRRVDVTLARAGDRVEVAVVDHGPGVAAGAVARLFRPFTRGAGADGPPGLGLGLALSRSMAQAMGGDLVHRPTDGGGATFVIVLPAA